MSILIFARRDSYAVACLRLVIPPRAVREVAVAGSRARMVSPWISVIRMLYLRDSCSKYSGKTNPIRVSYDLKTAVLISRAS
jgi:hypothetical protein